MDETSFVVLNSPKITVAYLSVDAKERQHVASKCDLKHPVNRCLECVLCPDMRMLEILCSTQSKLGCFLLVDLSLVYVAEINFHLNLVSVSMMVCQTLAVGQARGGSGPTWVNKMWNLYSRGGFSLLEEQDQELWQSCCCERKDGALERRQERHLTPNHA